jgi:hypothetical protein
VKGPELVFVNGKITPKQVSACVKRFEAARPLPKAITAAVVKRALQREDLDDVTRARFQRLVDQSATLPAELLSEGERIAMFRECHQSLRQGGRLIVIDSLPPTGLSALLSRSTAHSEPPPLASLTEALEAAGFRPVRLLAEREGYRFIEGLKS